MLMIKNNKIFGGFKSDSFHPHLRKKTEFDSRNYLNVDVEPGLGALIYCELGPVEHSGIYVGDGKVVHLRGSGNIEEVSLEKFTNHPLTKDKGIIMPVNPDDQEPYGCEDAFYRAKDMVGKSRMYHLLLDNCHQFCSGCITGDFENTHTFLWMVEDVFEKEVLLLDDSIEWIKRKE